MSEENSSQDKAQTSAPTPAAPPAPVTPPADSASPTQTVPSVPQADPVLSSQPPQAAPLTAGETASSVDPAKQDSQSLVDSLIKQTMVSQTPSPPPPAVPPEVVAVPSQGAAGVPPGQPGKKKRSPGKVMALVTMLILMVSIPVAVYYYFQKQQAVYQEGKAAGEVYPTSAPWGSCSYEGQIVSMQCKDGTSYSKWICMKKVVNGQSYLTLKPCVPDYSSNPACTDANKCTNVCPWTLTNGQCCPKSPDNCSNPGSYLCIPDPFIAQCTLWNSSCPSGQQYYWKAIHWTGSWDELQKDPRCNGGGNTPTPGTQRTPTPGTHTSPTPTPTGPPRPDACLNSVIDRSIMSPGSSVTITSTAKSDMNYFTYAAYNMDNLYGPGNPKPICVSSGGDVTGVQGDCPAGTHHLIFQDPSTTIRRSGSRTLTFEQIFVQDKNNGDKIPTKVQFNSYFRTTNGQTSLPNPACVNWTAIGCKNIRIYDDSGTDITDRLISNPSSVVKPGDTIQIGIGAGAASKGRARVNGGPWTESSSKNSQGMYVISFTIPTSTSNLTTEGAMKFDIEAEVYLDGKWQ